MLGFKPQPLNYSAQAESALRGLASLAIASEAEIMIWLADQIRDAVHFVMPEDGTIFDDKFKGIMGSEAHLPFPKITLEYYSNIDPGVSTEGKPLYKATRRVLLAIELTAKGLLDMVKGFAKGIPLPPKYTNQLLAAFPDGVIFVSGVFYLDYETPLWSPCYAAWLLPAKGWDKVGDSPIIAPLRERVPNAAKIAGRAVPVFWRVWTDTVARMGKEMTDRYIANDIGAEAFIVLELIEALSCRNVRLDTLQSVKPGVNERRVRDGKLPLYETKILTVDIATKEPGKTRTTDGADIRTLPREHLRRGHIQSYMTREGPVNRWKQSITVAVGNPGAIKKTYKLEKKV